jgi:CubicO group peptidase (beta-lactamase class C family)
MPTSVEAQGLRAPAANMSAMTGLLDSLERAGFSGSILVADRRDVLLQRTMGLADQSSGRKIGAADRWRWASVSKQVTAALVLREVDAGRISLDAPVSSYLPGFTDSLRATITVRQLLQHTSGLPSEDAGPKAADGVPLVYRERGGEIGDVAYARLCGGELRAAPGSSFNYNNCDYLVLGALLRARSGKSTEELLSALLGSAWVPGERETVRGYLSDSTAEPPFELATYGSAGGLTGTVESLLAFDRLLLDSLLSPASRAEMWRGEPKFGFAALGVWAFDAELKGCSAPLRLVERRGAIEGVQARNLLLPDLDLVIIMFTNRADEEFGEVWQGSGLMYDVLSAVACRAEANPGS